MHGAQLRSLADIESRPSEEPLSIGIDKADQCDRAMEQLDTAARDVIEAFLGRRIEGLKRAQCGDPFEPVSL